jgi:uncharacterized protein (TIGR02996 family)
MSITDTIRILSEQVAANPTDTTAALVLADAHQDGGDEAAAVAIRREVEALALRAKLVKGIIWLGASAVYTLGTAKAAKGYAARAAEAYLTNHPDMLVYVYHDTAITKTPFRKDAAGKIMYHRKSSGGKWARSVQMHRVSL